MNRQRFLVLALVAAVLGIAAGAALSQASKSDSRDPAQAPAAVSAAQNTGSAPAVDDDPFGDLRAMRRMMRHMYDRMLDDMGADPMYPDFRGGFAPMMDVRETADTFIVCCDLPGMEKDQIQIEIKNRVLKITGARKDLHESQSHPAGYYTREVAYGGFERYLKLPDNVDAEKVSAEYKNGVLTVELKKLADNDKKVTVTVK